MSSRRRYRTASGNLSRIKNLLEGYDNVVVMSTVDPGKGFFDLVCHETMEKEVASIMGGIMEEVEVEEV